MKVSCKELFLFSGKEIKLFHHKYENNVILLPIGIHASKCQFSSVSEK